MTPLTRRSFLQALGLSIPAVAAAKYLPADAVPVAKPDQTISLEDFKSEPKACVTKPDGRAIWINGSEYECLSLSADPVRSYGQIDITTAMDELPIYRESRRAGTIILSGRQSAFDDEALFKKPIAIRVVLADGAVALTAMLTDYEFGYSQSHNDYVTTLKIVDFKDVKFEPADAA